MGNPELGGVDPHSTVRWLHVALKWQNIKTEYVYYQDEGHTFERRANKLDALQRIINWLERYLG